MNKGTCYGVSVGPQAAGLITLEAIDIIKKADLIFLPSFPKEECKAYLIVKEVLSDIDTHQILCQTDSASRDASVMSLRHSQQYDQVTKYLDAGKSVAFLALGEVGLYSTYTYIHKMLVEAGYNSRLISGITSFQAIASYLGLDLASGKEEVHVFPDMDKLSWRLSLPGNKIFMKPRGDLSEAIDIITKHVDSYKGAIACGVSNFGGDNQIVAHSVKELQQLKGYFTVIFVKSDTAAFQPSASFFENRACQYFPCHKGIEHINCLFCYCPMYRFEDCLGRPSYKEISGRTIKVCTGCTYPHEADHYGAIMDFLKKQ